MKKKVTKKKKAEVRKIYYSFDNKQREGYRTLGPFARFEKDLPKAEEVEEITGEGVLEKVPNLISFIEHCYALLKPGGTATFTAPAFNSFQAWSDPRNIRGISQASLNFADKKWRDENNCPDLCKADFEVGCNYAIDGILNQKSEEAKTFWLARYNNTIQSMMFVLKKK